MSNCRTLSSERRQRGFTLAEILVTTAIFAIIMIAALAVYDRSNRVFKSSTEAADLQQSTRIGFDKLVSDIRMAGFDYSRGGVPTGGIAPWQPATAYSIAAVVDPGNGFTYTCTQAGTSGASARNPSSRRRPNCAARSTNCSRSRMSMFANATAQQVGCPE